MNIAVIGLGLIGGSLARRLDGAVLQGQHQPQSQEVRCLEQRLRDLHRHCRDP